MFINAGANVIIGADNRPLAFLKKEFPNLQFIVIKGYNISYPEKGSMVLKMFFSFPKILKLIRKEHNTLKRIISDNSIDIVISDNRFGLWNKSVKSVFITHQLIVKCPKWLNFFEYLLMKMNKYFINKFDECWVPDKGNFKLSGELSENFKSFKNTHLIGLLSRFNEYNFNLNSNIKYDILFILSGPEPQRTVFENIILNQLKGKSNFNFLIVRGLAESTFSKNVQENILMVDHLETNNLLKAILESEIIICRPGYSSIMDIVTLGKKAIFVPTPGQTEQEYLAKYYKKKGLFYSIKQNKFSIFRSLEKSKFYPGMKVKYDNSELAERVDLLMIGSLKPKDIVTNQFKNM